jgi:hypothetical protein
VKILIPIYEKIVHLLTETSGVDAEVASV